LNGMIVLPPELIIIITAILFSGLFEYPKHPIFTAFAAFAGLLVQTGQGVTNEFDA